MDGVEAAGHVELHDLVEFLRRGLPAGLADRPRAAGHVDQHVDAAEGLQGARAQRLGLRRHREVAWHHDGRHAQGAGLLGHGFDGGGVAPGQHQLRAFAGEGQRDGGAHALGRAGDQGHLVLELQIHDGGRLRFGGGVSWKSWRAARRAPAGSCGRRSRRPRACAAARWPRPRWRCPSSGGRRRRRPGRCARSRGGSCRS